LHQDYLVKSREFRQHREEGLWRQSGKLFADRPQITGDENLERTGKLFRDCDTFVNEIWSLDEQFFAELRVQLKDFDEIQFERVRLLRRRQILSELRSPYPVPFIDLTELEAKFALTFEVNDGKEKEFYGMLLEYEQLRTELLERHWRLQLQAIEGTKRIQIEYLESGNPYLEWKDALERINRPVFDVRERIKELNDRQLGAIGVVAPGEAYEQLLHNYRTAAFPTVYPDIIAIDHIFSAMCQQEELSRTMIEDLRLLWGEYALEHESLSQAMIREFILSRKTLCLWSMTGPDTAEREARFTEHFEERIALSENTVAAIHHVLGNRIPEDVISQLNQWKRDAQLVRRRGPDGLIAPQAVHDETE